MKERNNFCKLNCSHQREKESNFTDWTRYTLLRLISVLRAMGCPKAVDGQDLNIIRHLKNGGPFVASFSIALLSSFVVRAPTLSKCP
jgi:hypothetical protein